MNATDEPCAGEVMTRSFLSVAPEDTLGEVAERMAEADTGSALVAEHGRLTGILTSRDVLRAIAARVHPSEARVRDWMTAEPVTAPRDMPVDEAAHAMLAGGFHHLPVVEDERPVGVVGLRAVVGFPKAGFPGL
jgi:CBS domain-containing protein